MLAVTERTDKKEYTSCIWEYIAEFIYKEKKKASFNLSCF